MFLEPKNPGKKIRDICKELGDEYSISVIDGENIIYRDLGNGYDFEISGLDNRKKKFIAALYIWDHRNPHIVEIVSDIPSIEELKSVLDKSAEKYLSTADV